MEPTAPLTETQKKCLRTRAHALHPVVMVGQHGLKATVMEEITQALDHHQLIKVKLSGSDRENRDAMITQMVQYSQSTLVQRIGNIAILYRRNPERPDISHSTAA